MNVTGVIPQLRTTDLPRSIDFYVARLGFTLAFTHEDFYAGIRVGTSVFHLKLVDTVDPSIAFVAGGDHLHLYFQTTDVEADAQRLRAHGVLFRHEIADTPWGTREFSIVDPDGHVLYFGQGGNAATRRS